MRFVPVGEQNDKAITVKVVVDDDFCVALIDQFVDQTVNEYEWYSLVSAKENENGEYFKCIITEYDVDEGARIGEDVEIGIDSVRRAIQIIASGDIEINDRIRNSIVQAITADDTGEIDAEASDCIFQTIVFNEIRYG